MSNMSLWNAVSKTNPEHTKEVSKGRRKFNAICPQSQFQAATEQFGPYGMGWGLKDIQRDFDSMKDYELAIFSGVFWFKQGDDTGQFEISTSLPVWISKQKGILDNDLCKKAETDLVTKALSKIGFNADVFLGKFDDNRYVQEMQAEFNKPATISAHQVQQIERLLADNNMNVNEVLNAWTLTSLSELHLSNVQNMIDWIKAAASNQAQTETTDTAPEDPRQAKQQYFQSIANDVKDKRQQEQMMGEQQYYEEKRERQRKRDNMNQPVRQAAIKSPQRRVEVSGKVLMPAQVKQLSQALEMAGIDHEKFCSYSQIRSIGEMDQARFAGAMQWIQKRAQGTTVN